MAIKSRYRTTKRWVVPDVADEAACKEISSEMGVSAPMARLLYKRGAHNSAQAQAFIRMESGQLHDPYLLPDMRAAVSKICEAVKEKRKIIIYGDYDVDGVTSVSALYLYLTGLGATVGYYIPRRSCEGYGMSCEVIRHIIAEGAGLIITVDTGITAIEEIDEAVRLGCDVVVTDHHECREALPQASAVVNPQRRDSEYPFRELAGVGVVFKLLCALEYELHTENGMEHAVLSISEEYMDLVAIGTVADVMPVINENRLIVSYGLRRIRDTKRCGLMALMDASASDTAKAGAKKRPRITSSYISYTIAPRINAAGRISDAAIAVELFLSDDAERAAQLAARLCAVNRERQLLENVIAEQAYEKIDTSHDFEHDPVIVLDDERWHNGIIGIVASRVTEKYKCPSILISFEGCAGNENDPGKGSGRSVKGLNLVGALCECGEYLLKYGGHELAAGLTVERGRLPEFRRAINSVARRELDETKAEQVLTADDELTADDITQRLAEELSLIEPCGIGNPTPVFITRGLYVKSVAGVSTDKHTKLILTDRAPGYEGDSPREITAMCFSCSPYELDIHSGEYIDVMYNLDINEFRGVRSVQILLRSINKSEKQIKLDETETAFYRALRTGEDVGEIDYNTYVPSREDFTAVFRVLRHEINMGRYEVTARTIVSLTRDLTPINYVKVKLMLDIFMEMNILDIKEIEADTYSIHETALKSKVQLEKSNILRLLRSRYRYKGDSAR